MGDLSNARRRKGSRTQGAQNCVELANLATGTAVRDSKAPSGPNLLFGASSWTSFLAEVKDGRLDG